MAIIEKHIAAELFLQNYETQSQKKRNTSSVDVEEEQEDFHSSGESESDEDEMLDYTDDYLDESDDEN